MSAWIGLGMLVAAGIALIVSHDTGTIAGFNNADFAVIVAALSLFDLRERADESSGRERRG